MTQVLDVISRLDPDYLVAEAILKAFPDGDIVLQPEVVDGLEKTFTVIYEGEVRDGIQYFVGLYGEHNLEDMPDNPMNLEPLVLGVKLIDGRLTVADTLSEEDAEISLAVANLLMVAQYGERLTTDQRPDDPDSPEWTVRLEEYPEPVTCVLVAPIKVDSDTYRCYVGEGKSDGVTEYFLLIVQVIEDEFYSVDTEDDELWSFLIKVVLEELDIEIGDESDDDDLDEGDETDHNVC